MTVAILSHDTVEMMLITAISIIAIIAKYLLPVIFPPSS
jgi:hypothetical protein